MSKVLEVKGYTAEDKYKTGMRLYAVYQAAKGKSGRKSAETKSKTGIYFSPSLFTRAKPNRKGMTVHEKENNA